MMRYDASIPAFPLALKDFSAISRVEQGFPIEEETYNSLQNQAFRPQIHMRSSRVWKGVHGESEP